MAFEQLFGFLVLGHGRRRLIWSAITAHPMAESPRRFRGTRRPNISFATMTRHSAAYSRPASERWASGIGLPRSVHPGKTDVSNRTKIESGSSCKMSRCRRNHRAYRQCGLVEHESLRTLIGFITAWPCLKAATCSLVPLSRGASCAGQAFSPENPPGLQPASVAAQRPA
jgi:hypothetical protein